ARETGFAYYQTGPSKGWLQSITDALGRETSYQYDPAGRVTSQTLPDGRVVNYTYDPDGNLTSVTPPSRPAHRFDYTPVDQIADYDPPSLDGNLATTHYAYNRDRQITQITRPDGQTIDFTYNSGGKLETEQTPIGSYQYAYNATTGQLMGITTPRNEDLVYSWDGFLPTGTTWTGDIHGSVTRSYDNNFWLKSLSVSGNEIDYGHDADGLITQAGDLSIVHDLQNGLTTGTTLGSLTTSQSYNGFGELKTAEADYAGNALYSVSYSRDKTGRIVSEAETVAGVSHSYTYSYDAAGRLTTATIDGQATRYGYDANSNRISVNGQLIAAYDNQDRLLSYGQNRYTYTANGELLTKSTPAGSTAYNYDVLGNLREVKLPDGTDIQYVIDGQNRRIGKKVNGTLVRGFLYQGQINPIAELDGDNNVVATFVYGTKPNVPDYMVKNGKTYRIISDERGSPRFVIDVATRTVAEAINYDAWGNVIKDTNPGFQPFGFAGGLYDSDTGLVRFGARDYDPETGRWTAKDPVSFAGEDANLYGYAIQDPINNLDSSGLFNPAKGFVALLNGLNAARLYATGLLKIGA
ncbi:MAG TPA: RHS repeat-associated core domain-containing protein, partial [Candidatus Saccharimonadales bacterium]|nr:RHS repeat-associated core domain-containing protein [Candidatus Saccharimonadales bacterium]